MSRIAVQRRYLMCRPTYFDVRYAINPWMNGEAVDNAAATRQWETLRATYEQLGHQVDVIEALPDLPDMVFAANGALVIDGRVLGAQFRHPERADEAPAYRTWFEASGFSDVRVAKYTNEGEGDFAVVGDLVLAGTGFRTEHPAHLEAQEYFGRPVVPLVLVDPRFYHLDTALFGLDHGNVAYYPAAFSEGSRRVLQRLFPDALLATDVDAAAFGLNSISDGRHVVISAGAEALQRRLVEQGYEPIPVDMSEFRKAGGAAKCCTLEIRASLV